MIAVFFYSFLLLFDSILLWEIQGIYDGPGRSTSNTKSAKKMRRSRLHVVEVLGYNTDTAGDTEGKHYWLVQMASGTEWCRQSNEANQQKGRQVPIR